REARARHRRFPDRSARARQGEPVAHARSRLLPHLFRAPADRRSVARFGPMSGILYLVPTPIGDPRDITQRALDVLASADVVAAEDTRDAQRLFAELGVHARKLVSYHDHNERTRAPWLVETLTAGRSVALVSDAGTPLLSDPGWHVVQQALAAGARVV